MIHGGYKMNVVYFKLICYFYHNEMSSSNDISVISNSTQDHPHKSGKNPYSKTLLKINQQLFYYKNDQQMVDKYNTAMLTRLVLKLTPREIEKFIQLLKYIGTDPEYNTLKKCYQ